MVTRRLFMQALPLGTLSLAGFTVPAASAAVPRSPMAMPVDRIVSFAGDNVPRHPGYVPTEVLELLKGATDIGDMYLAGGAVGALEEQFATLLGKEAAAFMPTGTMANQIAIRLLSAGRPRVLLQKESHVYRDEADAVAVMSAIHPVSVDGGASDALYDGYAAAFAQSAEGPYPVDIGAVSIESPVRRLDGAAVRAETVSKIARLAKERGAGLHLDGARLLLMHGTEGFDAERYCAPFDTVYVSLYKYLGAPFGAILAGDRALVEKARQARHVFGGTMFHGWMAALIASKQLAGFGERFAQVHLAAGRLLDLLDKMPGIAVTRVENGSNIAFLSIDERVQPDLPSRLSQKDIVVGKVDDGRLRLTFNETILRRPVSAIAAAFAP